MLRRLPPNQADAASSGIDLTPLLDVVFIMLIFFIVTASFVRETGLDVDSTADDRVERRSQSNAILVQIDGSDVIVLDGRPIDRRALGPHLARRHAENPEHALVLEPSPMSSVAMTVAVLDAARAADIEVAFARAR